LSQFMNQHDAYFLWFYEMTPFGFLFRSWRDTDIGNTLHKDIGYSCEGY